MTRNRDNTTQLNDLNIYLPSLPYHIQRRRERAWSAVVVIVALAVVGIALWGWANFVSH